MTEVEQASLRILIAKAYWAASQTVGSTAPLVTNVGFELYTAEDFGERGVEARRLARLAIYHRSRED
jgi:hypothetical protein